MSKQYNQDKEQSTPPRQIQKIYTTPLFICFSIREPGKTWWWWLGRQKPYLGFSKQEKAPPASLRTSDVATEWLRSKIKGAWISQFVVDENRGYLRVDKADGEFSLLLGYKEGQLHFAECTQLSQESWNCFFSFEGTSKEVNSLDNPVDFDPVILIQEMDAAQLQQEWFKKNEKSILRKHQSKLKRKLKNIESDLEKLKSHPELYELARDLEGLKDLKELKHKGIKIKFAASDGPHLKADKIFTKAKKLKSALALQQERLEETHKILLSKTAHECFELRVPGLPWVLPGNKRRLQKVESDSHGRGKIFKLNDGTEFAIGTSAQENDHLRKSWANKDDLWLHIENITGAHLFLRDGKIPDQQTWEILASALRDHSNTQFTVINLVWTQVRNLRAVKGAAGLVRFSREKRIMVNYNPQWRNLLSLR